jgi:hypothetical protein
MAQARDLFRREVEVSSAVVGEDEVVARAVHLGEFQNHGAGT